MDTPVLQWLSRIGTFAIVFSVCAFVVINGIAALVFVRTQDRTLVNRWTGRVLAANLLIAGAGIGVPLLTATARLAISTFTSSVQPQVNAKAMTREVVPMELTPPR